MQPEALQSPARDCNGSSGRLYHSLSKLCRSGRLVLMWMSRLQAAPENQTLLRLHYLRSQLAAICSLTNPDLRKGRSRNVRDWIAVNKFIWQSLCGHPFLSSASCLEARRAKPVPVESTFARPSSRTYVVMAFSCTFYVIRVNK